MRSPIRQIPGSIQRWTVLARYLRWLDALAAWVGLWVVTVFGLATRPLSIEAQVVVSLLMLGVLALIPPIRARWRPVSALVALQVSRGVRPGDRAWLVRPGDAEPVLVTGCRWLRVVIAPTPRTMAEGITMRRTRALLIVDEPRLRRVR